jgi:hypothetical protein
MENIRSIFYFIIFQNENLKKNINTIYLIFFFYNNFSIFLL